MNSKDFTSTRSVQLRNGQLKLLKRAHAQLEANEHAEPPTLWSQVRSLLQDAGYDSSHGVYVKLKQVWDNTSPEESSTIAAALFDFFNSCQSEIRSGDIENISDVQNKMFSVGTVFELTTKQFPGGSWHFFNHVRLTWLNYPRELQDTLAKEVAGLQQMEIPPSECQVCRKNIIQDSKQ